MKKVNKSFTKIDWKNARFELTEENILMVVELDKEGNIIEESIFLEVINDLIGIDGFNITIKREQDVEQSVE